MVIMEGWKMALLGRNGAGKSTLARIIAGLEEADAGEIVKSQNLRIGYLEQKDPFDPEESVLGFLMRYSGRESWECGKMAGRFDLKGSVLEGSISSLPGGFQMRVKLTSMLLNDPEFLILDEPTNYLDLRTLLLLESFLQTYNGGFLIISHDREFLKRTCEYTAEVENGDISVFPGDVDEYLAFKEEDREQKIRAGKNLEQKQKAMQAFIDRFRAGASRASLVQSRIKQLERMGPIDVPHFSSASLRFSIPSATTVPGRAIFADSIEIGYPGRTIATGISFDIERGRKIAVLGDNGSGKTTLLRTLAEEIPLLGGSLKIGVSLRIGYYAQHVYSTLNETITIRQHLEACAAQGVTRQEILDMAGAFLFQGDDVDKPIRVLSGGERARLALAGVLLGKHDILLLDEPTNHLDFESVEALAGALSRSNATVMLVSHDRTFVRLTADLILEVKEGHVVLYPGTYEEYVDSIRLQESLSQDEDTQESHTGKRPISSGGAKQAKGKPERDASLNATSKSDYQLRKEMESRFNKLNRLIEKLSKELEELESEKSRLLEWFSQSDHAYSPEKSQRLEEVEKLLFEKEEETLSSMDEAEKLQEAIEQSRGGGKQDGKDRDDSGCING